MQMKRRNVFLSFILLLALFLGCSLIFLKSRRDTEIKKELNVIGAQIENDPIVEKLLESMQSTQSTQSVLAGKTEESKEDYSLTPEQKRRAEQLISLFENGKIEIQYGYAENLDDGRGITAGRAGFTTRDGDAYMVVKVYSQKKPGNKLEKYLDALRKLAEDESGSTDGLSGFGKVWKDASKDAKFRDSQDYVVDKLYFQPSQKYADNLGLKTAIARAFLYDTIIQHGDGGDKDSISALIKTTNSKAGGSPKEGTDELQWFKEFMNVRRNDLSNANDEETRDAWKDSVSRVDVYKQIFEDKNYDLKGPIKIKTKDYNETIP